MTDPVTLPPYDPNNPNHSVAYRPPETEWIEGDHPTDNPDGVTVSNVDYTPKTQEEKAQLLGVEMVEIVNDDPDAPPPEGNPMDEQGRKAMLARIHSPMELVEEKDRLSAQEANLRAGGSVERHMPGPSLADLSRAEGSPGTRRGGGAVVVVRR